MVKTSLCLTRPNIPAGHGWARHTGKHTITLHLTNSICTYDYFTYDVSNLPMPRRPRTTATRNLVMMFPSLTAH